MITARLVFALATVAAATGCMGEDQVDAAVGPALVLQPRLTGFRALAAKAPAALTEPRATEARELVELGFTSSDPRLRNRTRKSLLEADDAALALEAALPHADAVVRSNAAYELANLKRHAAVPLLLLRLKDEAVLQTRVYLADALARLGNLSALPELRRGMRDAAMAQTAGSMSMQILQTCGRPVGEAPTYDRLCDEITVLHRIWQRTGTAPDQAATTPDPAATARLARHMVDLEGFQLRQVDEARYVLSRAGRAALPLLERALTAEEPYLRQHALEVLRALGPPGHGLSPAVRALLQNSASRSEAIRTLGALGDREAIPQAVGMLADPDPEVQCAAAAALGPLRAYSALPSLRKILDAPEESMDLRVQAAFSLAILEPHGPGMEFLLARRRAEDYHTPTIDELIATAVATR